jgi:glycine rich protein
MDGLRTALRATVAATATCGVLVGAPANAGAETRTFLPTGDEQTFTVPAGVTSIHVIAVGARGGTGQNSPVVGGFGAVAIADIPVTPGETLYVNVGANGTDGSALGGGGFNGGGDSGSPGAYGGGGGGASDVRTISRAIGTTFFSRLVTAGGGGGSGAGSLGGAGGDTGEAGSGFIGAAGGGPGTATAGGAGGTGACAGENGQLGGGGDSVGSGCGLPGQGVGGGGGGGLYGGGAGGTSSSGAGGGGGSSGFAPEATNRSVLTDTTGSPAVTFVYPSSGSPGGGPGGGGTTTAPALVIDKLRVARRIRRGRSLPQLTTLSRGHSVSFTLSKDAAVTLSLERKLSGRRARRGRRTVCVKPTLRNRRARRCTRYAKIRPTIRLLAKEGTNRVVFQGRLSRSRSLTPGSYRLTVTATDSANQQTTARRASFRLLPAVQRKRR